MSTRSGWCQAPPGALTNCDACRFGPCDHECHDEREGEMAQIPVPVRVLDANPQVNSARIGANKAAPGGASTPLIQGPRRPSEEID